MTYVTSDWHGCAPEKIQKLLSLADFCETDYLFVLGDVIDRGEHGVAHLKWLMEQPNVTLLLGNHEKMLLENEWLLSSVTEETVEQVDEDKLRALSVWEMNGAEPTIVALQKEAPQVRADILEYLHDCPLFDSVSIDGRDFLLVHAGLGEYHESKRISDYTEHDLLWSRPSPHTHYSDTFVTILGHTPTGYYSSQYRGRILKTPTWWDVDTGAAAGLSPMLLRLDDEQEFYVE